MKNYGVIIYFFYTSLIIGMEINNLAFDSIPIMQRINNHFHCIECDRSFKDKHNASQHLIDIHLLEGSFLCPHCEKYIKRFTILRTHHKAEAGAMDNCSSCYAIYKTDLAHWKSISLTARLLIDRKISSGVARTQIESLLNNMITWKPSKNKIPQRAKLNLIQCINCKRDCKRSSLRKHIMDHIITQEFQCSHLTCQKKYRYYSLTWHHKNEHGGPRNTCTDEDCQATAAQQKVQWQQLLDENEQVINKKVAESIKATTLLMPDVYDSDSNTDGETKPVTELDIESLFTDQDYDELTQYLTMDL